MSYDHKKQCDLNLKHAHNPEIGDYWHEMFSPVCIVLDISRMGIVSILEKRIFSDKGVSFDTKSVKLLTRKDFVKWIEYPSIKGKFWADVMPERHRDLAEEVINEYIHENA